MKKHYKLKNLLLALIMSLGMFILVRPVVVSALIQTESPQIKLYEAEVRVDNDGYSQIIIKDESGQVSYITHEPFTHANPQISEDTVVWMAQIDAYWQIFMHSIPTGKTTQLTSMGNNVNPKISNNYIVWEGFSHDTWQIFLFDGLRISQLTEGEEPKQDVAIERETIVYSQKEGGMWQIYSLNIADKIPLKVSMEYPGRKPVVANNLITWESYDQTGEIFFEYDMIEKKLTKVERKEPEQTEVNVPEEPPAQESSIIEESEELEKVEEIIPVEMVTVEDIKEELNLEVTETIDTIETTETPSEEPEEPAATDTLFDLEDIEESTATSGN